MRPDRLTLWVLVLALVAWIGVEAMMQPEGQPLFGTRVQVGTGR